MNTDLHDETSVNLTLREAAELYEVTVRTLAQHLRCGRLIGYKSPGATRGQWWVTREALDSAGYARRRVPDGDDCHDCHALVSLRRQLSAVVRVMTAERRRADELDRRLGHALLECGRLRAALAAANGEPQEPEQHLDQHAARWLITAITGDATVRGSTRADRVG